MSKWEGKRAHSVWSGLSGAPDPRTLRRAMGKPWRMASNGQQRGWERRQVRWLQLCLELTVTSSGPCVLQYLEEEYRKGAREDDPMPPVQPYHYGSHYSNSGTVLHFLVRMPPFTKMFLAYQGKGCFITTSKVRLVIGYKTLVWRPNQTIGKRILYIPATKFSSRNQQWY